MTASLLGAALYYASKSHPVFPCRPGEKVPATKHGFRDASTDPEQIRAWWTTNPHYNIGLPTGHAFDVLVWGSPAWSIADEDTLNDLCPGDWIGVASTPQRGLHIYLPPTGAGISVGLLPGLNWIGRGGYILAAPSVDGEGTYVWRDPPKW